MSLSDIKFHEVIIEGIEDESHSDRSFGIKRHNMAEPAMNDRLMKGTVPFVEM